MQCKPLNQSKINRSNVLYGLPVHLTGTYLRGRNLDAYKKSSVKRQDDAAIHGNEKDRCKPHGHEESREGQDTNACLGHLSRNQEEEM